MHELLVKGGMVIDPSQGIHGQRDIGISNGKITDLAPDISPREAKRVIDVNGHIVTPGLIDIHAHVADGIFQRAIPPDIAGVISGVTTVCDAGSTGWANFIAFRRFVIPQVQTDVFALLNLSSMGLPIRPELWCWQNIDREAILKTIAENRNIIKGIKLRAVGAVMLSLGVETIRVAKKIAGEAGLPFVVHIGIDRNEAVPEETVSNFTKGMLSLLGKGDIVTHIYQWKPGGVIRADGTVLPEFREAIKRGVILDIGQAGTHCSFEIARKGLEMGIIPTTLSTDLGSNSIDGPVFSLPATMSRFLALGMTLNQVIAMTTINAAKALGEEERRGSLKPGTQADISIMKLIEGDFVFGDGMGKGGKPFKGNLLLSPQLTLKSGVEIKTQPRFKNS